ncbi:FAD-dependent oxidoreductase [Nisaea nitritireducens]|uniref:FAD-dependent oxidoreductase n=1 Tax=Nisaea nitritireducens TaxID=568392 RepID=UPI0029BFC29C|nr:FAD-dependent oxidoreductase [Nisaea nitritireducens]
MRFGKADLSQDYDVIVLGAGAGGMTAAVVAANEGLNVLLLEKTNRLGGTTALSGGMVWAPNSAPGTTAVDTVAEARTYLDSVIGILPGATLRQTFLERAPEAIDYLGRNTAVQLAPLAFYPDYYPDLPGATLKGRVLEPLPFDGCSLGEAFALLRDPLPEFTLFGGMMVARTDIPHFRRMFRSPRSALRVARLLINYGLHRLSLHRGASLVLGNALAGRLMKSLMDLSVSVALETHVMRLLIEGGRAAGVVVAGDDGRPVGIKASRGVILATGGFSHNQTIRRARLPENAGSLSAVAPGATGDGLGLGEAAGGAIPDGNASNAFWVPVSTFRRENGAEAVYPHTVTDRGKPGMLAVASDGCRFTNEANSYHEFVSAMLQTDAGRSAVPCHLICDSNALWRYGLGAVKPMTARRAPYLESGYLIQAQTLADLADRIGVDAAALEETVTRYNADAESGTDTLFGRGSNAYHRYVGDSENSPNPCMRPLTDAPYYAVKLQPGDLGTAGGLLTNENAEVLSETGTPIPGLYACGNDMNSIMAGCYPGPGITLGPALVFGYLAAMHITGKNGPEARRLDATCINPS